MSRELTLHYVGLICECVHRYKNIAEQYWNETHDQHAKPREEPHADGGSGFKFDPSVCRRVFDAYDRDGSGFLEIPELSKLAEELWAKFHPEKPKLSRESKDVSTFLLLFL